MDKTQQEEILKYDATSKERRTFEFERDNKTFRFVLIPINEMFAKIAGLDSDGKDTKLEDGYTLVSTQGGKARKTFKGKFVVTWFDAYTLSYKGSEVLKLKCQRQQ